MSHLLQLVLELCLLFLGLRYFDGANNSLRFLLRLQMVLKIFAGNNCLRESSLWRRERLFLIIPSILGKLGLEVVKNLIFVNWFFLGLFALASVLGILETS